MRRRLLLCLASGLLIAAMSGTGSATNRNIAVCAFEVPITLNPGLSATNGVGQIESLPGSGTMRCTGWVNGTINPEGTMHLYGWFGVDTPLGADTCDVGSGTLGVGYNVPAEAPGLHGFGSYSRHDDRVVWTGLFGALRPPNGILEIVPADGQDCVTVPITSATASGTLFISH